MREFYQAHRETVERFAFFVFLLLGVFVFFKYVFVYVMPFFFGLLIALIMEPLIRLLMKKLSFNRAPATTVCLVLFVLALGILGTLMVSNVFRQLRAFIENAPGFIADFSARLDYIDAWLLSWSDRMPEAWYVQFPDIRNTLVTGLTALFGDGVKYQSLRIVSNVPDFLIGLILSMVSAFFLMKDRELIGKALALRSPAWLTRHVGLMRRGLSHAVGGYFRAQFILMAIVGTLCIGGLLIMRNPYALLIGLMIALLDFLPFVGSGVVLLPWVLFSLLAGQFSQAVGLAVLYGVVMITRQVLEPKILGEQIGVHPLVTLMSLYAGYKLFGLFGILIGPSLVMVLKATRDAEKAEALSGAGARYNPL